MPKHLRSEEGNVQYIATQFPLHLKLSSWITDNKEAQKCYLVESPSGSGKDYVISSTLAQCSVFHVNALMLLQQDKKKSLELLISQCQNWHRCQHPGNPVPAIWIRDIDHAWWAKHMDLNKLLKWCLTQSPCKVIISASSFPSALSKQQLSDEYKCVYKSKIDDEESLIGLVRLRTLQNLLQNGMTAPSVKSPPIPKKVKDYEIISRILQDPTTCQQAKTELVDLEKNVGHLLSRFCSESLCLWGDFNAWSKVRGSTQMSSSNRPQEIAFHAVFQHFLLQERLKLQQSTALDECGQFMHKCALEGIVEHAAQSTIEASQTGRTRLIPQNSNDACHTASHLSLHTPLREHTDRVLSFNPYAFGQSLQTRAFTCREAYGKHKIEATTEPMEKLFKSKALMRLGLTDIRVDSLTYDCFMDLLSFFGPL